MVVSLNSRLEGNEGEEEPHHLPRGAALLCSLLDWMKFRGGKVLACGRADVFGGINTAGFGIINIYTYK
jgi:hypothetical protein